MGEQKKVSLGEVYKKVIDVFKESSYIMYMPESQMTLTRFTRNRTPEEITRALWQNVVTDSDILIMYAVYVLGVTTIGGILPVLRYLKKKNPELVVPTDNTKNISSRLQVCCENGLVQSLRNEHADGTVFILYYITNSGFSVLRKRLMRHIYGDQYLGANSLTDIYGIAASAYTVQSLLQYINQEEAEIVFSAKEMTAREKKCTPAITHVVYSGTDGKKDCIYAVEPMYLEHNASVVVKEDIIKIRRSKIKDLEKWSYAVSTENIPVKVVFVCENLENALKVAEFVKEDAPFLEDKILYTSEHLIRVFERVNLERYACLKVFIQDGKRTWSLGDFHIE